MLPFLIQNEQLEIEMKQTLYTMQNITQDTCKIYSKQSNRRSKHDYTTNCYRTTSNILINGPEIPKFMSNELKLIVKIIEDMKIQINTQNIKLKSILCNITTDASHKESKSSTTTNKMNETKTCIGQSDKNESKLEQNTEAKTNECNNKYQNENENQSTSCEICNSEDHDNMIECSEYKKWIHYECSDLPPYMICSLSKGRRKCSCQNCADNDEISKYTKMLNRDEWHNKGETNNTVNIDIQTKVTTEEKEIENLKVLLGEKQHKINILEETQYKNETTISVMKEEIEKYKNEKQFQTKSIKQKTEKIHAKNKQYRKMKIRVVKMKQ